jgi:hypothetical protein
MDSLQANGVRSGFCGLLGGFSRRANCASGASYKCSTSSAGVNANASNFIWADAR